MAGFTEKIHLLFDVDSGNSSSTLGKLKSNINDADGAFGKAKAGAAGLSTMIKENMGAAALAAGTALVTFGIKAVGAFEDTAKAALNLGSATGLSVEDASRWIAVGDDMEITAEGLTTAFGKVEQDATDRALILIQPNPLNLNRYVVLNSGFTYREYDYLNNARQVPKLPDWAVIDVKTPPNSRYPGKVVSAGFFGEDWGLRTGK